MTETCCYECKTNNSFGVCQNRRCICHIMRDHRTGGGSPHPDPTGELAIGRVMRRTEPKRKRSQR